MQIVPTSVNDWWVGKPEAFKRSSKWPKLRAEHLKEHPKCEACGNEKNLEVHHMIPVSHGGAELDKNNLITLCENGPNGINCHFCFGHSYKSWKCYNPNVIKDSEYFKQIKINAICKLENISNNV